MSWKKNVRITIKLFAGLQKYLPPGGRGSSAPLDLEPESTIADVIAKLGLPIEAAKLKLVNSTHAQLEAELHDGDVLAIFPPVGGG